jgi:uncharacterized protein (TIGR02147 family)
MNRPSVYDFLDHHSFLKAWMEFLKESKKKGVRALGAATGVSPAALSLCLAGERNWTLKLMGKIIPHLELKKSEQEALRLLYIIGTTEDPNERLSTFDELRRLPGYAEKQRDSSTIYLYLRHWLNVSIRELVNLPDFKAEASWIAERLRFSPSEIEIERSLKFLIKENYIQKSANEKWSACQRHLDCQEGVFKLSLGEYHRQVLMLAQRSIEEVPRELRLIMGHTSVLDGEQKLKAEAILKNALAEIQKLETTQNNPDTLYQFELVMIPLSKKGDAA